MTIVTALKEKANAGRIQAIESIRLRMCDKDGLNILQSDEYNPLDTTQVDIRSCNRGDGVVLMCKLIWKTDEDAEASRLALEAEVRKALPDVHKFKYSAFVGRKMWKPTCSLFDYTMYWMCVYFQDHLSKELHEYNALRRKVK